MKENSHQVLFVKDYSNFLTCCHCGTILHFIARGGFAESWIALESELRFILQPLEPELGNASEGKRHGREISLRFVLGGLY